VRATATFVRMDSILTRRDMFDDNGGRRGALGWNRMRARHSIVNTNGDSVYKERGKVDAFVKALIQAYNLPPEYVDVMLYNTEDEGMFNAAKKERTKKLSYEFESVLRKALKNQGITKMKALLREFEPKLNTHERGYNYANINAIRKREAKQGPR